MAPDLLTCGMFGILLIWIICGVSLSIAMAGTAVLFGYLIYGSNGIYSIVSAAFGGMWSILLFAIPLLTFIGVALAKSRIASDLYHAFCL